MPTGITWVEKVKELAALANVTIPDDGWSPEDSLKHAAIMRKKSILEDFHNITIEAITSSGYPGGRDYLEKRGWPLELVKQYEYGYYPSSDYIKTKLEK